MTTRQERLNGKATEETSFLDEMNEPVTPTFVDETPLNVDAVTDYESLFSNFEKEHGEEMTGEMLTAKTMEEGKPYNFVATGFTTIADKVTGEPRKALKLIDKDRNSYTCASFVLMSAIDKIDDPFPYALRLISLGTKEGKNNNYWNLKVFKL
jgi:hypothetical protein